MFDIDLPPETQAIAAGLATAVLIASAGIGLSVIKHIKASASATVKSRWISGLIIAAITVFSIYAGGFVFAVLIATASWVCADELLKLLARVRPAIFGTLTYIANLSIIFCAWAEDHVINLEHAHIARHVNLTDLMTMAWIVIFLLVPVFAGRFRNMPENEERSVFAVICSGWFLAHLILLRNLPTGFGATMFLTLGVCANDTLAYICGSLFGRTKLSATLSPKKTVEGLIGGTVATYLFGFAALWLLKPLSLPAVLLLSTIIAVLAPCGDLAISAIKRDAGTKDSGAIIPGHGGMLDRAGSFFLTAPVYYYAYALLAGAAILHL